MNRQNPYRRSFIKMALITSPLFGLIGGAPLFVFNHYLITPTFYFITAISLFLWTSNILLFEFIRTPGLTELKRDRTIRIMMSFAVTFIVLFIILMWFDKHGHIPPPPHHHDFPPPDGPHEAFKDRHPHDHHFGPDHGPHMGPPRGPGRLSFFQPMIFGFSFNFIQLIIMDLVQLRADRFNMQNELNKLKVLEMEARHNNLIEQLNPHFLFNSLNTLKAFIGHEPDKAVNYLVRLSNFLRKSISEQRNIISLQQELQLCSDYMELQKMRFPLSINTEISLGNIDIASVNVPRYSIQTLLENAIKHNVFSSEKPLQIIIQGKDDEIMIRNSINPKFEQHGDDAGTGLQNLTMRYEILSGKKIRIEQDQLWFSVYIPLLK